MQYRTLGRTAIGAIDAIDPPGADVAPDGKIDARPALLDPSSRRR